MNYKIIETDQQVENTEPEFVSRFRWRAERRCLDLNRGRRVAFYRYEVHRIHDHRKGKQTRWRWGVLVMQNKVEPLR